MRTLIPLLIACAIGCNNTPTTLAPATNQPVTITAPTMGTQYTVKLYDVPAGTSEAELKTGIESQLNQINSAMSTWQDDSELSRFNQNESTDWFEVSPETASVVAEAIRIHKLSSGAFDVTVNPLLKLWGFGPYGRPEKTPSAAQIAAVQPVIGSDKIEVRTDPPALRKTHPSAQIVLSGIAKGYAVDRVADWLTEQQIATFLVEIGGEVRAKGTKPDGMPWSIGIEKPTPDQRSVQRVIQLSNRALATSGDYRNFYEEAGQRYSHTIDPRTGKPITHRLAAVSVVAESCMTVDAIATALMVLGPEAGYNLAVEQKWAAYFLVHDGEQFVEKQTPQFEPFIQP